MRAEAPCVACGWLPSPGDEYCQQCGLRLDDEAEARRLAPAPSIGAATHVGRQHDVDEDAVAVALRDHPAGPLYAVVVCDGVSSSSHGDRAATAAAEAAMQVLLNGAEAGPAEALREAVRAAHRAACAPEIQLVPGRTAPGTTLVAAVAHRGRVDVAWVGDSRAYLLDGTSGTLLTHDHSWINEMVDSGALTIEEAVSSPNAHILTHCLGPLEAADPEQPPEPSVAWALAPAGSRLLLCTDGIWNETPGAAELAEVAAATAPSEGARAVALQLIHRSLSMGARDDVTAAVVFL